MAIKVAMLGLKGIPATYGGVERVAEELGARLAERGYDITVYCRAHYTLRDATIRPYRGMRLVRLPSVNAKYTDTLSHTLLAIIHALISGTTIFHIHSVGPAILAWIPRLFGRRVVVHVHGQEWKGGKWGPKARLFFRFAEYIAVRSAHEVVVISHTLERYYAQELRTRTHFVSQGVTLQPLPAHRVVAMSPPTILFVGRLVPEKGCHTLIKAVLHLPMQVAVLVCGGADHADNYLESLKREAPDNVTFLGYTYGAELNKLYREATLYVQPSIREGVSLTLLEAMAAGCCIIASDIPEIREVLGDSGTYAPPGDVNAFRTQIVALLQQPERRGDLGRRAFERAQALYSWDAVADAVKGVYDALRL